MAVVLGYIAIRGPQPGPFFLNPRGQPITKAHFVGEVRIIIGSLGFPQEQFAGHSFRIGAATSAALAGMEDSSIQLLGRWSSAAFLRYICTPPEKTGNALRDPDLKQCCPTGGAGKNRCSRMP